MKADHALTAEAVHSFTPGAVFARVAARVAPTLAPDALDRAVTPLTGDHAMNPWSVTADFLAKARAAAVLIALIEREDGVHVLLTRRTSGLRDHSGQIAFPGGKVDPDDASPAATALREAWEEVGLAADHVEVMGYLGAYLTRTGFRIVPVVARVRPPFALTLNPAEVVETFEVPFAFLMSEANHTLSQATWKETPWHFYKIDYEARAIWGITAGILRILYETLYL